MSLDSLIFFFLMLAIGYGVARTKLISEQAADTLPGVLLNVCYPGMVLHTFTTTDPRVLLETGLPTAIATLAVTFALFFGVCLSFAKHRSGTAPTGASSPASATSPMPPFPC